MAIKIDFVSDVSKVTRDLDTLGDRLNDAVDELQGIERAGEDGARGLDRLADSGDDAARSLDDTQRALKDTGDAADHAGSGVKDAGDDFEKMSEGVEKDAKAMSKEVEKAFREMGDESSKNTSKIAKDTGTDMHKASEATATFKDEAKQNFSESMSSFDGSLDGLVDMIQGTMGGVAADLGPKGMIGAGLIAAAIGIGVAVGQSVADGINEKGEIAAGLAQQIADLGGVIDDVDFTERMDEWGTAIQDNREWWEVWQGQAETGLEHVKDMSERAGMSFTDMFHGIAGNGEDAQTALDAVNAEIDRMNKSPGEWFSHPVASPQKMAALGELSKELEDNVEVQKQAQEIEESRAEAIGVTTDQIVDQIKAQDELSDTLSDSVSASIDYADTLDDVNETVEKNGKVHGLATKESRENEKALISLKDAAYDMASAQVAAGESTETVSGQIAGQRQDFIRLAEQMGYTSTEAGQLADSYGLIPDKVITDVKAQGVSATKAELNSAFPSRMPVTIDVMTSGVNAAAAAVAALTKPATKRVNVEYSGGTGGGTRPRAAF